MNSASASNGAGRSYDIVVFGATGFTGKLTAEYLLRSPDSQRITCSDTAAAKQRITAPDSPDARTRV